MSALCSAERAEKKGKSAEFSGKKLGRCGRRAVSLLLCLCMTIPMLFSLSDGFSMRAHAAETLGPTQGVTRQADPSTMDKYTEQLNFTQSTRNAGRLWSDKTVFAFGSADTGDRSGLWDAERNVLTLSEVLDGVNGTVELNDDFLHVYSVLGSSLQVNEPAPVDLVLALDISGSMGSPVQNESSYWVNTVDPEDPSTWGNGLGYYAGKDSDGEVVTDPTEDKNGIPDEIIGVLPAGTEGEYTNATNGQMAPLTAYNNYLAFCNALIDAILGIDADGDGIIDAAEAAGLATALGTIPNIGAYMDAAHRTKEYCQPLYSAYRTYKETLNLGDKNAWISDPTEGEAGRNAAWPSDDWKDAYTKATGNGEPESPMLNAFQAPNRMFYVIRSANAFIQSFLSLNPRNRISVVVYDSVATVLMPLAHYKADGTNYLSAKKHHWQSWGAGQWACTVTATAIPETGWNTSDGQNPFPTLNSGDTYTASVTSWGNTDTEAAVTAGLDILAQSYDSYGDLQERLPMLVLMTDGAANAILTGLGTDSSMEARGSYASAWTKGAQTSKTTGNMADRYNDADGMVLNSYTTATGNILRTYNMLAEAGTFADQTSTGLTVYGAKDGHVYGSETNFPTRYTVLLHTLMSIAFQKTLVEKHYNQGKTDKDNLTESLIYTIGFGLDSYSTSVQALCSALLDPKTTFYKNVVIPGEEPDAATQREQMISDYYTWLGGESIDSSIAERVDRVFQSSSTNSSLNGSSNALNDGTLNFPIDPTDLDDPNISQGVTPENINDNIRYNEKYFEAVLVGDGSSNQSLQDVFSQILGMIQGVMFAPVGGTNDLGVGDSITYVDPMGKYMDVKDVKNLILFGTKYDIVKTAVYDYKWNDAYIKAMRKEEDDAGVVDHKFTPGETPLPQGWYNGDPTADAKFKSQDDLTNNGLPDGCSSAAEAWADGWVFRVSYKTAAQFVPTLSEINSPDEALAKERNTEYTFYRINAENEVRTQLHMNPAYGTSVPDGAEYKDDQSHLKTPGVYALADLRIWVEDSGDFSDTGVGETLTDSNYDEALWVNIPVNMLPLRRIVINQTIEGNTYTSNLAEGSEGYKASFPLRVFYTVGVSDEVLDDSGRINIAGTISTEYIEENKVKTAAAAAARGIAQGNLEFFSNWYNPLNRYGDYVTANTDYSYGDPVTSFSPDAKNRYYVFEKALPLYNTAYVWVPEKKKAEGETYTASEGSWKKVKIGESTEGTQEEWAFLPTDFGGKLIEQDLEPANTQDTSEARQQAIWDALNAKGISTANDGDIILLKTHRLTNVTKPEKEGEEDPFPSDGYFFLPIEYYELDGDDGKGNGNATKTQYVIARKGSEFGSAYKAAGITNGDMLCWHDVSGKYAQDYPYLSYSETGDPTRGKAYIGYPIDPNTGYYQGYDKSEHTYPKDQTITNPMSDGEWVVCAKPGGLRVGDLAQNVQSKGGSYEQGDVIDQYINERYHNDPAATNLTWGYYAQNVTRTANNYYVPTIGTSSNIEESDIKVNVYLGNNGRLTVMDTTLLVTKMVELPAGITTAGETDEEFNFQIYIDGLTGTQSAVVVQWMEASQSWQRQFHYVDLELDSQLFLQASNGAKAVFDEDGCRLVADPSGNYTYAAECTGKHLGKHSAGSPYEYDPTYKPEEGETPEARGDIYYVFIGRNKGTSDLGVADTAFRVYHNENIRDGVGGVDKVDVTVTTESGQGSTGTFYATTVWLVSDTIYNKTWVPGPDAEGTPGEKLDPNTVDFVTGKNSEGEPIIPGDYYTDVLTKFELMSIDPNVSEETTDLTIQSPYRTISAYWTKTVTFGVNSNNDGSGNVGEELTEEHLYDPIIPSADRPDYFGGKTNEVIAEHTAEFTLKHGQALLFNGIPSGAVYRVTEKLTDAQMKKGYALKEVRHNQQVGSVSTYRPGAQALPVYYDLTGKKSTFGEYGGKDASGNYVYPSKYANDMTENGLMWAVNQSGATQSEDFVHYEPFFHTNAMVWEAYSTMDVDAKGDNHHQPLGFLNADKNGISAFWVRTGENSGMTHTVLDNPSCKSLAEGGCDEVIDDKTVRHYFFKDGEMRDFHYQGEGSGFIRNIGRFITSPTVHFGVVNEKQTDAETSAQNTKSNTRYTGVYSVFGNTSTHEESANFVNTIDPDLLVITKHLVDMEGNIVNTPLEKEFEFTIALTQPGEELAEQLADLSDLGPSVLAETLYVWKGDKSLEKSGLAWSDGTNTMPNVAPNQTEYQKYILPADATDKVGLEPLALTKSETDGTYTCTVKLKANQAIVLYGLTAGTDYTITEKKLNKYPAVDPGNYKDVSDDGLVRTGTVGHDIATYLGMTPRATPNQVDFYNQMFGGKLTVEKRIEITEAVGDDMTTREFGFSVTLTPAGSDTLAKEDLTVAKYGVGDTAGTLIPSENWTDVTDEYGNKTGALSMTFALKHGERVEISGIPLNTSYTVKEIQRDGYNLQHVADNKEDKPDEDKKYLELTNGGIEGTVTAEKSQAYLLFVNGKAVAPPFTGGIGASEMMFGGFLLIGLAGALFLYGWRRKRRVI